MSELSSSADRGPRQRGVEIGVAVTTALFGIVAMIGSMQAGIGWADEGPRAGFFPFYVGLAILISSAVNFVSAFMETPAAARFADWGQLRSVLSVVAPTAVYVATMPYLGIYVTSALLLGAFMKWFGRYSWIVILLVAIGVPVLTYVTFERWFLVPLPKGPLEDWLGL
jgi:putative tricarboxylic transport membrane protein